MWKNKKKVTIRLQMMTARMTRDSYVISSDTIAEMYRLRNVFYLMI